MKCSQLREESITVSLLGAKVVSWDKWAPVAAAREGEEDDPANHVEPVDEKAIRVLVEWLLHAVVGLVHKLDPGVVIYEFVVILELTRQILPCVAKSPVYSNEVPSDDATGVASTSKVLDAVRKVGRGQVDETEGRGEGARWDTVTETPDEPDVEVVAHSIDICSLVIVSGFPRTIETLIAIFVYGINGFSPWIVPAPLIQVVWKWDLGCNETHYVEAARDSD